MDSDRGHHSNVKTEDNEMLVEDKCTILIEECDKHLVPDDSNDYNADAEVNTLSREEKFRVLNMKCERLIKYLSSGSHMRGLTQNQKRIVRSQAKSHIWDKAKKKLYYTATKDSRRVLVVRNESEVDGIIHEAHLRSDGGHHGINNTAGNIAAKYFWNNIRQDVMDYVSKCYHCQSKNRGSSRKAKEGDTSITAEADNDEDVEFTHEATKALIEAVRKRYGQLSERHARPIVYKEVQEELAHKGFCFNKERVRRKWNTLVAMHKRMRREFFEVNPTWEYYQMIDGFHGDVEFGSQDNKGAMSISTSLGNSINTSQGSSISIKQGNVTCDNANIHPTHQDQVFSSQEGNGYVASQVTSYSANQVNSAPLHYGNSYPSSGEHTYTSTLHHSGPYNVSQGSNCTAFQGNSSVVATQDPTHIPQQKSTNVIIKPKTSTQGNATVTPKEPGAINKTVPMFLKIVPDLSGIQGVNTTQVQPITVVGTLPGHKEVRQVSGPQIVLNKQLPKQNVQLQNAHDEFMRKHEKLKLKTLLRIEKELKNLSQIQCNILSKQELILSAVKGNGGCEENTDTKEKPETAEQVNKKRKT